MTAWNVLVSASDPQAHPIHLEPDEGQALTGWRVMATCASFGEAQQYADQHRSEWMRDYSTETTPPIIDGPCVYFVRKDWMGPIKIGFSSNLAARYPALATACDRLDFLGAILGDESIERRLHSRFRAERIRREWFRPSDALLDFVLNDDRFRWIRP